MSPNQLRRAGRKKSYPALLIEQNKHRFFFTTIPVDDLFAYCFVSRRDEDSLVGFQRALSETRARDIAQYLTRGKGSIPTNIVLSAQPRAELTYSSNAKTISYKRRDNAFMVLDGQHRLWGYELARRRHRVPVAIYQKLSPEDEVKLFIDINTTQRGVPTALLLDIKHLAGAEGDLESVLRSMFDRLNKDPSSAVTGRLSAAKSIAGRVSRVTFNKALSSAIKSGVLSDMDEEDRYRLIRNYINAFDAELADDRILTKSAFFEGMFDVFEEVVRATASQKGNVKQVSLQEIIRPLAKSDYASNDGSRMTKAAIATKMKKSLRENVIISEDML